MDSAGVSQAFLQGIERWVPDLFPRPLPPRRRPGGTQLPHSSLDGLRSGQEPAPQESAMDGTRLGKRHRDLRDVCFTRGQFYHSVRGVSQHVKSLYVISKDRAYDDTEAALAAGEGRSPVQQPV